jgi:RNA polymerase sigma-70 factor (ECF subfamily)
MSERDRQLVERCRQGDEEAFEVIVDCYQRPAWSVAYRITGNPDDAADVVQSVFLKILEKLDAYDPRHKLFSWIYRITVNESLNLVRRRRRDVPLEAENPVSGDDPARAALQADRQDRLQAALMSLKSGDRAVLVLRHVEGLSYEEISGVLEIPESLVKSRLFTARHKLRRVLLAMGVNR